MASHHPATTPPMRRSTRKILDNLSRMAQYLRDVGNLVGHLHGNARAGLYNSAAWLDALARHLEREEVEFMRVANVISGLEAQRDAEKGRADRLQAQLDGIGDKLLDDADLAALTKAEGELNPPQDTNAGGTGTDTTTGAAGAGA